MHITGIVAEYNPFHNGHAFQIESIRKNLKTDFILVVMSGNFSQRGLPTLCDKFIRTRMALLGGADLVLELPTVYASASAERFAQAAISLLNKTQIVNTICFGSESGHLSEMMELSEFLNHPPLAYQNHLKASLKAGLSFPRARTAALKTLLPHLNTDLLLGPNNILGIEYLKALLKYQSKIIPYTLKRQTADYHSDTLKEPIASASAIRKALYEHSSLNTLQHTMPETTQKLLRHNVLPLDINELTSFLYYKFMFSKEEDLYTLWDIPSDMIRSLKKAINQGLSYTQIIKALTSKTYSTATVQRALYRMILSVDTASMLQLSQSDWIPYIRVLGCKNNATPVLKAMKDNSSLPLITNFAKAYPRFTGPSKYLLDCERHSSFLYHSLTHRPQKYHQDFSEPFIRL